MEMSLALSPSNGGGDEPGMGPPSIVERLCCSSSCTWSSQDMEEVWVSSMASLKAICWASGSSTVLSHDGQGGVGSFQSWGQDELWGHPPHGVWDVAHLLLWLCHSLALCPLLDSLWDRLGFVALGSLSSHSRVLLSGL